MRFYVVAVLLLLGCTEAAVVDNTRPSGVEIVQELPTVEAVKPNDDVAEPFAMTVGTVGRIIDGDTIELADGAKTKLRIAYVDCPEKGEPWHKEGIDFATEKLLGKKIKYFDLGPDKYKRTLAQVYATFSSGNLKAIPIVDYGRELIRKGLAKRYKESQQEYVADEELAKETQVGIWSVKSDAVPSPAEPVTY